MVSDKKTVLIVDDESSLLDILTLEFESEGYAVLTSENGRGAIEILKKQKADVVVSDIRMSKGSGIELLNWITENKPGNPPLLFMSGFSDISPPQAFGLGAEGVFNKPFDFESLLEAVEVALLPFEERWGVTVQDEGKLLDLKLEATSHLERKSFALGRGGMFVVMDCGFPRSAEKVRFAITMSNPEVNEFKGCGIIKWVRREAKDNLRPGIGVEFTCLTENSKVFLKKCLEKNPPKSYIPYDVT